MEDRDLKQDMVIKLLILILKSIPKEWLVKLADMVLDLIEKQVEESKNKYDDSLLILTSLIRNTFSIKD